MMQPAKRVSIKVAESIRAMQDVCPAKPRTLGRRCDERAKFAVGMSGSFGAEQRDGKQNGECEEGDFQVGHGDNSGTQHWVFA